MLNFATLTMAAPLTASAMTARVFAIGTFDLIWFPVVIAYGLLAIIAVLGLAKRSTQMSFLALGLWSVLIILVPVIGAALWLWLGRSRNPIQTGPDV